MQLHNCRFCTQKYANERNAKRCCTYKASLIEKEEVPKTVKVKVKLTAEQRNINAKLYYEKNREIILAKQRIIDKKRKDGKIGT